MSIEPDKVRLPSRLFFDGQFHLPIRGTSSASTELQMRFPVKFLEDSGVLRFVFSEFHGAGFELRERQLLVDLVDPSHLFIDVGAHFGLFSLVLSKALPGLHCLAVEPAPENFDILSDNVHGSGFADSIALVQCAVGDRSGNAVLRLNSSMGHHLSTQPLNDQCASINVDVKTLPSLLTSFPELDNHSRSIWLKIDTEGREARVLEGARDLFQSGRISGVLWEFRVGHLVNPDRDLIQKFFDEFGFESFQVSENNVISVRDFDSKKKLAAFNV